MYLWDYADDQVLLIGYGVGLDTDPIETISVKNNAV